jgi:hypothetical protein
MIRFSSSAASRVSRYRTELFPDRIKGSTRAAWEVNSLISASWAKVSVRHSQAASRQSHFESWLRSVLSAALVAARLPYFVRGRVLQAVATMCPFVLPPGQSNI